MNITKWPCLARTVGLNNACNNGLIVWVIEPCEIGEIVIDNVLWDASKDGPSWIAECHAGRYAPREGRKVKKSPVPDYCLRPISGGEIDTTTETESPIKEKV